MAELPKEFIHWMHEIRHPTYYAAWEAGREDLKKAIIRMLEQQILLDRDQTISKISEAVRDL